MGLTAARRAEKELAESEVVEGDPQLESLYTGWLCRLMGTTPTTQETQKSNKQRDKPQGTGHRQKDLWTRLSCSALDSTKNKQTSIEEYAWSELTNIPSHTFLQMFSLARDQSKHVTWLNMRFFGCPILTWRIAEWYFQIFKAARFARNIWRIINTIAPICRENKQWIFVVGHYLFLEQKLSADKYHSMFLRQMEATVCLWSHQTAESMTNKEGVTTWAKTWDNRTIAGVQTACLKSDVENNMDMIRRYSNWNKITVTVMTEKRSIYPLSKLHQRTFPIHDINVLEMGRTFKILI